MSDQTLKDRPIGSASLAEDGTITLMLRAETEDGQVLGDAIFKHAPGDPQYADVLAHAPGLAVGHDVPVLPWGLP